VGFTVAVVLPCFNEEMNLSWAIRSLPSSIDKVILVDACSTDRRLERGQSLRAGIKIICQPARGKGLAMVTGMLEAKSDFVVFLDADGSMCGAENPLFVTALVEGSALVWGSRGLPGRGSSDFAWIWVAGNHLLTKLVNPPYGVEWTDLAYVYFALRMDAGFTLQLSDLIQDANCARSTGRFRRKLRYGYGFEIESLVFCRAARTRFTVQEVLSFEERRRIGNSNLHAFKNGVRVAYAVVRERLATNAVCGLSVPPVEPIEVDRG
jgi:glycosyltransferase involved in cell wall biosynthesis